ncbi:YciI family protein [Melittangium boletus]|uniref:Dehydrogenase n=1 Tax=Melittangium boletus DSM 14713 TaxID=1294270 RepID=A0A250I8T6_9BACT|nr:YciI family protein [Melittangium boletus]ATB27618.1 dehydrogenase [Melittangium boletus DSM 14713]
MAYLLLIIESGEERRNRPAKEGRLAMERMNRFNEDLKARGICKASESLRSDAEGVRIAVRGGRRTVSDGPFTETKEIVGGFFLLDCQTKEQALAIANECPAAEWATVEVREVGPCYDGG